MQTYEGYYEDGIFTPIGKPVDLKGKQRVTLTVVNEPVIDQKANAKAWREFFAALDQIDDEPIPEFERVKFRETDI